MAHRGCCGEERKRLKAARRSAPPKDLWVPVRYAGKTFITMVSSLTGESYTFAPSGEDAVQLIDPRDVSLLLQRRNFKRST